MLVVRARCHLLDFGESLSLGYDEVHIGEEDAQLLVSQKTIEESLLDLTEERLLRYGIPGGPAIKLSKAIQQLKQGGEAIARLWQTLLAGEVELKPNDRIYIAVLPDGLEWLTEPRSELFIRPATKKIDDIIRLRLNGTKGRGVVMTGKPGIGKSWSLCYFLMELAKEKKTVIFESASHDKLWVFRSDGTTYVISHPRRQDFDPPEFNDPHTIYLFDTAGDSSREPLQVNAYTVVASSPSPANYNQFLKRVGSMLYLPCWTLEDLSKVLEYFPHVTKEMLEVRFLRFGGIPRYTLPIQEDIDEHCSDNELEIAFNSCDLQSILRSGCNIEVLRGACHRLLHYEVNESTYFDV